MIVTTMVMTNVTRLLKLLLKPLRQLSRNWVMTTACFSLTLCTTLMLVLLYKHKVVRWQRKIELLCLLHWPLLYRQLQNLLLMSKTRMRVMFINKSKRFTAFTQVLRLCLPNKGTVVRAAIMPITSHQIEFDQLEMLHIVHLKGKILHAVNFMTKFFRHFQSHLGLSEDCSFRSAKSASNLRRLRAVSRSSLCYQG